MLLITARPVDRRVNFLVEHNGHRFVVSGRFTCSAREGSKTEILHDGGAVAAGVSESWLHDQIYEVYAEIYR